MSSNLLVLTPGDKACAKEESGLSKDFSQRGYAHPDLFLLRYALVIHCHSLSCEITVTCQVVKASASLWEKRRNEVRQRVLPGRRSFPSVAGWDHRSLLARLISLKLVSWQALGKLLQYLSFPDCKER